MTFLVLSSAQTVKRAGAGRLLLVVAGMAFPGCTAADRNGGNPPPANISQLTLNPTSVDFQFTPGGAAPAPLSIGLTGTCSRR